MTTSILTLLGIIVVFVSPVLIGMFRKRSSRSRHDADYGDRLEKAKTASRAQVEARSKINVEIYRNSSGGGPGW
ncbi:hypothetical protein [Halobacillus naozhouensis]|uniref:Uncharacterized protein n=1 Tax=Halobacillus naozhouensis TaxID=554880 RepID=A0ABY8J479_9BACI|nr:hypothetical protein [Halobacillus naozhouensis]WFT75681.1 hypothetical protein P9989_04640 [Halobacillus naozhouensis]